MTTAFEPMCAFSAACVHLFFGFSQNPTPGQALGADAKISCELTVENRNLPA
jgi:hypothetical protein